MEKHLQSIVIPKRGFIARGICCSAAGPEALPQSGFLAFRLGMTMGKGI